jgi:hypothetical protein
MACECKPALLGLLHRWEHMSGTAFPYLCLSAVFITLPRATHARPLPHRTWSRATLNALAPKRQHSHQVPG